MNRMQHARAEGGRARGFGAGPVVTASAYVMLFILGGVQGLIGTFQYSRGPVPLAAICFAAAILATCVLGAWGMGSGTGGLLPAAGWILTTLLLGSARGDSVLITNTTAGKWFLFGGAACAAAGVVIGFALWSKTSQARRASR
ncbi:MAG: hypothetical protein ACLQFR_31860 [Streptosporangiaceae bacterium]